MYILHRNSHIHSLSVIARWCFCKVNHCKIIQCSLKGLDFLGTVINKSSDLNSHYYYTEMNRRWGLLAHKNKFKTLAHNYILRIIEIES